LDTVFKLASGFSISSKILYKKRILMSDRRAAEKLFCQLLADYIESILPDIVSDWDTLSADQQQQITRMNNFRCISL
jgi:hypothetical protein